MAESRLAIWALDNNLTLEDVLYLLKEKDYKYELEYLNEENVSEYDKTLQNEWRSYDPSEELQIKTKEISGETIHYISAVGQFETSYGENRAIVNGQLLPRDSRIFNNAANALFFVFEGRVFCAVEIGVSQESRVRSSLFGQRRGRNIEEWGKINVSKPVPYSFDSRFFYWLIGKKGTNFKFHTEESDGLSAKLIDISAVSHLSKQAVYDSSSEGADILGSVSALSGLGTNQSVYQSGVCFSIENITLFMKIESTGTSLINLDKSKFLDEEQNPKDFSDFFEYTVLVIYRIILPRLLDRYAQERNEHKWTSEMEATQRKEYSLRVIRDLCEENELTLEDIADFFDYD